MTIGATGAGAAQVCEPPANSPSNLPISYQRGVTFRDQLTQFWTIINPPAICRSASRRTLNHIALVWDSPRLNTYQQGDAHRTCTMEDTIKRIIVTTALLLGTAVAAQAQPVNAYRDLIRPNGHPRNDAIHKADLSFCYQQTGQSRYSLDGPAFKKCMLSRGYRLIWQRDIASGSRQAAPSYDLGPIPDSYQPWPDTGGMNTSTNATWGPLAPGD